MRLILIQCLRLCALMILAQSDNRNQHDSSQQQANLIQTIFLNDRVAINHTATDDTMDGQYNYYKLVLPTTIASQSALLIQGFTKYNIQLSIFAKFTASPNISLQDMPNQQQYTLKDEHLRMVSLAIPNLLQTITNQNNTQNYLLLTIYVSQPCYIQWSSIITLVNQLIFNEKQSIQFDSLQYASIFKIKNNITTDFPSFVYGQYILDQFYSMQAFRMQQSFSQSSQLFNGYQSVVAGANSQLLKVNNNEQQWIFIKITSLPECILSIVYTTLPSKFQVNKPFWGYYQDITEQADRQASLEIFEEQSDIIQLRKNLYIQSNIYVGFTTEIYVQYSCAPTIQTNSSQVISIWEYVIWNSNGESAKIVIPYLQRLECLESLSSSGYQTIKIMAINITDYTFFRITVLSQSDYRYQPLFVMEKLQTSIIGINGTSQCKQYEMMWILPNVSLVLQFLPRMVHSLNAQFQQCEYIEQNLTCTPSKLLEQDSGQLSYQWIPDITHIYRLQICSQSDNVKHHYQLNIKLQNAAIEQLNIFDEITQIIQMNEIKYYELLIQQKYGDLFDRCKDQSVSKCQVKLKLGTVNGLISISTQHGLIDELIYPSSFSQQYSNDGPILLDLPFDILSNSTIYIGVKAFTQSIYRIEAYVDEQMPQPQPEPEFNIVTLEDGQNILQIASNKGYILKYSSHIIPYSIITQNIPIRLQLFETEQQAMNITTSEYIDPQLFFDAQNKLRYPQVFLRVFYSNNETIEHQMLTIQFQVLVPDIILSKLNSVLIACRNYCATNIIVSLKVSEQIDIVYHGTGILTIFQDSNSTTVSCKKLSACNMTISAVLPFGGELFIQDAEINSKITTWEKQIEYLSSQTQQINLLIPLNKYSLINTLLLHYPGSCIDISYTEYTINRDQINYLGYQYLAIGYAPFTKQCKPFTDRLAIQLKGVSAQDCEVLFCMVTMSLYINEDIFPINYDSNLNIHYALNSYQMHIPIDTPYMLNEIYGIRYFSVSQSDSHIFNATKTTIIKLSESCSSASINYGDKNEQRVSIQLIQPCSYVLVFSECSYPSILTGIPHRINMQQSTYTYYNLKNKGFKILLNQADTTPIPIIYVGVKYMDKQQHTQQSDQCSTYNRQDSPQLFMQYQYNHELKIYQKSKGSKTNKDNRIGKYLIILQTQQDSNNENKSNNNAITIVIIDNTNINKVQMVALSQIKHNKMPISTPAQLELKYYSQSEYFKFCYQISASDTNNNFPTLSIELLISYNETRLFNSSISYSGTSGLQCKQIISTNNYHQTLAYSIQLNVDDDSNQNQQYILSYFIDQQQYSSTVYDNVAQYIQTDGLQSNCFNYQNYQSLSITMLLHFEHPTDSHHIRVHSPYEEGVQNINFSYQLMSLSHELHGENVQSQNNFKLTIKSLKSLHPLIFQWCIESLISYTIIPLQSGKDSSKSIITILPTFPYYHNNDNNKRLLAESTYHIYQLLLIDKVEDTLANIIIEITSCSQQITSQTPVIVGSTLYKDIATGVVTNIEEKYTNSRGIYVARGVAVTPGYYYIGIKNTPPQYSVRVFIDSSGYIPHSDWELSSPNITVDYNDNESHPFLTVMLSPLVQNGNLTNSDSQIFYDLYIVSKDQDQNISISCKAEQYQGYHERSQKIPIFKITKQTLAASLHSNSSKSNIKLHIYGKASLLLPDQNTVDIHYQYNPKHYQLEQEDTDDQENQVNPFWVVATAILVILIAILIRFLYKIWKRRRNLDIVEVQLTESTRNTGHINNNNSSQNNGTRTNAQNESIGYGQFVDEIS